MLNKTNVRSLLLHTDASDYAELPITKLVSPSAMKPIAMINAISITMKITPKLPMRMKIARSFLEQIMTKSTKRNIAV